MYLWTKLSKYIQARALYQPPFCRMTYQVPEILFVLLSDIFSDRNGFVWIDI